MTKHHVISIEMMRILDVGLRQAAGHCGYCSFLPGSFCESEGPFVSKLLDVEAEETELI